MLLECLHNLVFRRIGVDARQNDLTFVDQSFLAIQ